MSAKKRVWNPIDALGSWAAKEMNVPAVTWEIKFKYEGKKPFVRITFIPAPHPNK